MLGVSSLRLEIGGRPILDDISLAFPPGELTAIVGPNGAGKSTLLSVLAGDRTPDAGSACLDGAPLNRIAPVDLASRRAVLPQATVVAFPFTVHELVRLGVIDSPSRDDTNARVAKALDDVELGGFGARFIQQLSGGEQQRAHFARVLCQAPSPQGRGQPRYLLLDEPTASLDLRHQMALLRLGRAFADGGGGVVAILHDLNLAAAWADRIVVLKDGRVAADGPPSRLIDPAILEPVFDTTLQLLTDAAGRRFILPYSGDRP